MKNKKFSTIILILIFLAGLSLLLYPTISDYWNSFHQSKAIATYTDAVEHIDENTYEQMWSEAEAFNASLKNRAARFELSDEQRTEYNQVLNVTGTGMMGYIEIPSIGVSLPIYHSTDDEVLQIAAGHIEWSNLPIGGAGTHSVLSSHRGLPSAKLFTDLDKVTEGDLFVIRILNESLTYEVDQIRIVLPSEVNDLEITEGKDYCTLVTCTPYGINTHRLLVRGHRVENQAVSDKARITADAMQIEPIIVASVIAAVILIVLTITVLAKSRKKKG